MKNACHLDKDRYKDRYQLTGKFFNSVLNI